jgi:cytosine/adenosine deaminase-related metal-dependent hydrolase
MIYAQGQIYQNGEFVEGYIGYEDGIITEFGEGKTKNVDFEGIIVPTFVNSHTHIADSVIQKEIKGAIEDVVAPPDGLKHRILRETPKETLIESMKAVLQDMKKSGIQYFADFREGGVLGADLLLKALSESGIESKIFGRPSGLKYDEEEMDVLLDRVDGIGLSALSDLDQDDITRIAHHTKRKGKMFALHASERVREDIDTIMDLKPDFLIHMNKATEEDLKLCAENDLPVILCPRSEVFFGCVPDIPKMLSCGVTLALGTDNAMVNSPSSLLREMEFAYKIARLNGGVDAKDVLKMVFINPHKVLNVGYDIGLTLGMKANFLVFDISTKEPAYALVNGASRTKISMNTMEESPNNHIKTED